MTSTLVAPRRFVVPGDLDFEFAAIVAELTRRGFLAGGIGAAGLLGLAACGSGAGPGPAASAATRRVSTAHGEVTIPVTPKRIASLDFYVSETLWDMGAGHQVGCPYYTGESPRYARQYAALAKTSTMAGLNLEAIAKLSPDLIISLQYPYIDAAYDKLTAIAPTVVLPFRTWDVNAAAVADVTGHAAGLRALKQRYAARVAAVKAKHGGILGRYRFDMVHGGVDQGQFWLIGQHSVITPLLKDVGVQFASGTADETSKAGYRAVSYENLTILDDADAIIYWSQFGSAAPGGPGPQLFGQQLWKDVPAVKAGLVPIADFAVGGYGDAIAALGELDAGLTKLEQH